MTLAQRTDLAGLIREATGFKGTFSWDATKPNGQPRRRLDVTRARERFGFVARTSFRDGIAQTVAFYESNRAAIDARKPAHGTP